INPRPAVWQEADYIISNPPFIGNARMRDRLGDGYTEALRKVYPDVPDTVDFVMYWWHKAAELIRLEQVKRFGFITTNSISQVRQRSVIDFHLKHKNPIRLIFVIPDHPWVDDGAGVRIAMTAAEIDNSSIYLTIPRFAVVVMEDKGEISEDSASRIRIRESYASCIFSDLKVGADITSVVKLIANRDICGKGMELRSMGFFLNQEQVEQLGYKDLSLCPVIKKFIGGRDLTAISRNLYAIDLFGLSIGDVEDKYPNIYQWIYERVKPDRDMNRRKASRDKWWIYGEARATFRPALENLHRLIVTPRTAKHRVFSFISGEVIPESEVIVIASSDAYLLGVMSTHIHVVWALASGGDLGGNTPRYNNTRCFDPFPFPDATLEQKEKIRQLGERLDLHRKQVQAQHPEITITGMYNLLEKLRKGEDFTDKDREYNNKALVSTLKQIHDELDNAVLEAYGWEDLISSSPSSQLGVRDLSSPPSQGGVRGGSLPQSEELYPPQSPLSRGEAIDLSSPPSQGGVRGGSLPQSEELYPPQSPP
ncbi:MAG: DNA methyltransferase, partial [Pseudanabaena sp.]